MIPYKVEVQANKSDELIEGVLEGHICRFYHKVCLESGQFFRSWLFGQFPEFQILVELEEHVSDDENQNQVVACRDHYFELFVERFGCVLGVDKVDDLIPIALGCPAHIQIHP